MAQPKPAFYVAVLLVVLGLVGLGALAIRRDRAGRRRPGRTDLGPTS